MTDLDTFLNGYVTCALWSSMDNSDDNGGDPLDANYDESDIDSDTLEAMRNDCKQFMAANKADLDHCFNKHGLAFSTLGNDFWLTRNGHGAGFWDRGLGAAGERLSNAARFLGDVNLYVGDDGKIYA